MTFVLKHYAADLHLGHAGILPATPGSRPFETVEDMDRAILAAFKDRVGKADLVYIVGDFALSKDAEYVAHCFHSIPGRKVLLLGNHDLDRKGRIAKTISDLPWDVPPVHAMEVHDGGNRLWLSHYGHRTWPASHYGSFHLYGHSHGSLPPLGRSRDVGIDLPDMALGPRTWAELRPTMAEAEPLDFQR